MNTISEQLTTCGDYPTEAAAWSAFDAIAERHIEVFSVFKEVEGWYIHPRIGTEIRRPRIDRILVPKQKLVDAGWTHGPIGIEGKPSGQKAGPAICQAMDYGRAVFLIESGCRPRIALEWIFLWPVEGAFCDIASIMIQHRIGCVHATPTGDLVFSAGGYTAMRIRADGGVFARELLAGRRVGAR